MTCFISCFDVWNERTKNRSAWASRQARCISCVVEGVELEPFWLSEQSFSIFCSACVSATCLVAVAHIAFFSFSSLHYEAEAFREKLRRRWCVSLARGGACPAEGFEERADGAIQQNSSCCCCNIFFLKQHKGNVSFSHATLVQRFTTSQSWFESVM